MGNPRPAAASGVRHGRNGNTARRGDNARRLIKKTHEEEESQLLLDNERMKERRGYLGYAPRPSSPRGGLETSESHFLLDETMLLPPPPRKCDGAATTRNTKLGGQNSSSQ